MFKVNNKDIRTTPKALFELIFKEKISLITGVLIKEGSWNIKKILSFFRGIINRNGW